MIRTPLKGHENTQTTSWLVTLSVWTLHWPRHCAELTQRSTSFRTAHLSIASWSHGASLIHHRHISPLLPSLPSCQVRRMKDEQPWCFRCWGIGHISRYCSGPEKCAWYAGQHHSLACPHRPVTIYWYRVSLTRFSVNYTRIGLALSPTVDTSQWQCPRCRQPGVNVWHGCTRRPATSAVLPT